MASVKIDLGFGEHAILSERAGAGISTAKHQRDAEEFLRRWPRTRSIEQESRYLRQLGLQGGYSSSSENPSDTSAVLRAAVKSGKVTVVIERATTPTGGVSASGPTRPPYPLYEREKTAWAAPARKAYSYDRLPNYDDVSANDLVAYLEDFVSRTSGNAAAPEADSSTPLGAGQPFSYAEGAAPASDVEQDAGIFLTPAEEMECEMQYEADMAECSAYAAMDKSSWGMCKERAMSRYSNCLRGFG